MDLIALRCEAVPLGVVGDDDWGPTPGRNG